MVINNNLLSDDKQRNYIIFLINNNNIIQLENYLELNNIKLNELNNNDFDILIYSIESNASFNILKYVYNKCQYKTLNYNILSKDFGRKSPLLSAISKNNFAFAEFLLKNGADIYYELCSFDIFYYLEGLHQLNTRNLNFIIKNGYNTKHLEPFLVCNFIENSQNNFIKIIFNNTIFDNIFILKLVNMSKFKRAISNIELKELINNEKFKIKVQKEWYEKALANDNYEILEFLYNNDIRDSNLIFLELLDIIKEYDKKNHTDKRFKLLSKIKNSELNIKLNSSIIDKLTIPDNIRYRKMITLLIKKNNIQELKNYINYHQINLSDVNSKEYDLLISCIEIGASVDMFVFLMKEGNYTTLNYFINRDNGFQTPLIAALSANRYDIANILFINGADGNFNIKDMIPSESGNYNSIAVYLYEKNLLNNDNLFYLIASPYVVPLLIPRTLMFKFIDNFNNDFIATIFQNCRIPADNQWYRRAIEKENYEAVEILYKCDRRAKSDVVHSLLEIFDSEDSTGIKKITFINSIKNYQFKSEIENALI